MIKISIVNYTNTLPFKWALKKSNLFSEIDLQEDIPSICAQKLIFNQVDLALVPVALLAEMDEYYIETNFCIGTNGKVDSVKLYSEVPLNKIKTITLDYQSKTSINLAKLLCKFFWKIDVTYLDSTPNYENKINSTNAAVVIGDRTFLLNNTFKYEYDLAEEWQHFTGLPFVFAAWVSSKKLNPDFISQFNLVLKYGVDNCLLAINENEGSLNLPKHKAIEYLTQRISYNLDSKKIEALNLFLSYISKL